MKDGESQNKKKQNASQDEQYFFGTKRIFTQRQSRRIDTEKTDNQIQWQKYSWDKRQGYQGSI